MQSSTPETDEAIALANDPDGAAEVCELCKKLEHERDELRAAVRNMRDAKGRHHTQIATEHLFSLLPETKQP